MVHQIPSCLLDLYKPMSGWESLYLRARWRLCPYELVESLIPKGGTVLDLGCGCGLLGNLIALQGPARYVVGIDSNVGRIGVARRSAKKGRNITFHSGTVEGMEMEHYDAVVMTDLLHHLDEAKVNTVLSKVSSSLSRNGVLAILDVDKAPFWKFYIAFGIDRVLNPASRLYYRSAQRMKQLLARFSLATERTIPAHKGLPLSDIIYLCRKKNPYEGKEAQGASLYGPERV